jgi:dTDP-4-dehydrorhamnose reductase
MKVMIVGCTGPIGQELVKWAPSQWEVLTVDRPQLDITDYPQVSHRDSSFCSNAIINAAYTAVDKVECEPALAFAINRGGPQYLVRTAIICGVKLLHIDSEYVLSGDRFSNSIYAQDIADAVWHIAAYGIEDTDAEPGGHYHFICAPYITLADFFSVVYHKGFIANQAAINTRHLLNVFQTQSLAARISKTFLSFNPAIGNPHSKESQLMYE